MNLAKLQQEMLSLTEEQANANQAMSPLTNYSFKLSLASPCLLLSALSGWVVTHSAETFLATITDVQVFHNVVTALFSLALIYFFSGIIILFDYTHPAKERSQLLSEGAGLCEAALSLVAASKTAEQYRNAVLATGRRLRRGDLEILQALAEVDQQTNIAEKAKQAAEREEAACRKLHGIESAPS